ncbi:hypothetical protein SAMN05216356_1345 [Oribacterium sp. WCC10]|nr:hypothetical protein SAMN05216356_1345 [Oribacterium sp. WCC10]
MKLTSVGFIFIVETVRIFVLSKSAVCMALLLKKERGNFKFARITSILNEIEVCLI